MTIGTTKAQREEVADAKHRGRVALEAAVAGAGTVVECKQSAGQIHGRMTRYLTTDPTGPLLPKSSPSSRMASIALGLTLAALAKPRPEREEPEAFDECTGPLSGGER